MSNPSDIEDNYPEFPFEQTGFTWDAFDNMPTDALQELRNIWYADVDQLASVDPASLGNGALWAYAARHREDAEVFAAAANILTGRASLKDDIALNREAVFCHIVYVLALRGASDEAEIFAQRYVTAFPESDHSRVTAWAGMRESPARVSEELGKKFTDLETMFEIAEDFAEFGFAEFAIEWIERIETQAAPLAPVRLDCVLLRERLLNHE